MRGTQARAGELFRVEPPAPTVVASAPLLARCRAPQSGRGCEPLAGRRALRPAVTAAFVSVPPLLSRSRCLLPLVVVTAPVAFGVVSLGSSMRGCARGLAGQGRRQAADLALCLHARPLPGAPRMWVGVE